MNVATEQNFRFRKLDRDPRSAMSISKSLKFVSLRIHERRIAALMVLCFIQYCLQTCIAAPFAYITNQGEDSVSVIDLANNQVTNKITVGEDPAGVDRSPEAAQSVVESCRTYPRRRDSVRRFHRR